MPHRFLTLVEAAEYLHVSREDIELLVKRDEIPFVRNPSKGITFQKKSLDEWASQRILGLTQPKLDAYHKVSSAKTHDLSKRHAIVSELLQSSCIAPALPSRTKPSVLRDMVALAEQTNMAGDPAALLASIEERERLCSTAMPGGVALLHPRYHEPYQFLDSFIVLGRTVAPIPFGAMDGRLTDIFFMICCQDDRIHLHVLARLCMMCTRADLPEMVREAETAERIALAVKKAEELVIASL